MVEKRACSKCGREKKLTPKFWQRDATKSDGFSAVCKTCRRTYDKQRDAIRNKLPARRLLLHVMAVNARARALGDDGVLTVSDVLHKLQETNYCCYWCNSPLGERFDIEHIKAFARGGKNAADNIVVSCRSCNSSKGQRTLDQWLLVLAMRGIPHELAVDVPIQMPLMWSSN